MRAAGKRRKKKRSARYRILHNFKRSHRRRLKKHADATALLHRDLLAAVLVGSILTAEQQLDVLLPGARLPRVREAMKRLERACQFPTPRSSSPDREFLARPHRCEKLNPPTRIRYLVAGDPPMLKMFPSLTISPSRAFNGTVASYQPCPKCEQNTLRIFPASRDGEFYFRCHCCGTCLTTFEFLRLCERRPQLDRRPPEMFANEAFRHGYLAEPVSPETLRHYDRLARWRGAIESGRRQYREYVQERPEYARFGDWLKFSPLQMQWLLWDAPLTKRFSKQRSLVRVSRNVNGFACGFILYIGPWIPEGEIKFTHDTFALVTPAWCDFVDWYDNIVACPDDQMAVALERAVAKWPEDERIPVTMITETSQPLEGSLPFRNIWLPVRPQQSPDYGLMLFGDGGHNLRVTRFPKADPELKCLEDITKQQLCPAEAPQCVDAVAEQIARDGRDLQLVLNEMLAQPHVGEAAGRALVARVAQLRGIPVEELSNGIELRSNVFCFRLSGALYVVRDGQFWKKSKRDREFQPITNFSLRIEGSKPHHAGNNLLDVVLTGADRQVHFAVTEAEFNNSNRLWRAARTAAASANLPYPHMTTVPERKLLPELVRGSHAWYPVPPRHRSLIVKTVVA